VDTTENLYGSPSALDRMCVPLIEPDTPPPQSIAPTTTNETQVPRWMAKLREQLGPPPPRILLGPIIPARLGGIHLPQVEQPPMLGRADPKKDGKPGGLTPDEHHDRIRQAAKRLEKTVSREQVRAVREVEENAERTRRHLVAFALRVPAAIAHAQEQIRTEVRLTTQQITQKGSDLAMDVQTAPGEAVALEEARLDARQQVLAVLSAHQSDEVTQLRSKLDEAVGTWGPVLNGKLNGILGGDRPGSFHPIPAPDDPVPSRPPPNQLEAGTEPALLVSEGIDRARDTWKIGDEIADRPWLTVYADLWRCTLFCERVVPSLHTAAADQIRTASENALEGGVDETFISLLGLVAPSLPPEDDLQEQCEQPRPEEPPLPTDETERQAEQHRRQIEAARIDTEQTLFDKTERANAFLEQEVRDKQIEMLRITGERLQRSFYQKAAAVHLELMNKAGPIADRYRHIADSTGGLLKSNVQLDSTQVVPKLEEIEEQAEDTRPAELEPLEKYGDLQIDDTRRTWRNQERSFAKMVEGVRDNLADLWEVTNLDLVRTAAPFTHAGYSAPLGISSRIPEIARNNAEQILKREEERRSKGADGPIIQSLFGLFNATLFQAVEAQRSWVQSIAALDDRYFEGLKRQLRERIYDPLKQDVNGRRQKLEMNLTPGDVDSTKVLEALALTWPGPRAVEEAFNLNFNNDGGHGYAKRHRDAAGGPFGSFIAYVRPPPTNLVEAFGYLTSTGRAQALGLLSAEAETRGRTKLEIALESFEGFLVDEDYRTVLLSLSDEERAALQGTGAWDEAQQKLHDSYFRNQANEAMALLHGRTDEALAWVLREKIQDARGTENTLQIESAVRGFDSTVALFLSESAGNMGMLGQGGRINLPDTQGDPTLVEVHRLAATRQLAFIITQDRGGGDADILRPDANERAAEIVANWATRPTSHTETDWLQVTGGVLLYAVSPVLGVIAGGDVISEAVDKEVVTHHGHIAPTIVADLLHGGESDQAFEERVRWAYGRRNAADGDYDTSLAIMIDGALQDQPLLQARFNLERLQHQDHPNAEAIAQAEEQLAKMEEQHQRRILIAAKASGWTRPTFWAQTPRDYLVSVYGPVFDEIDDDWGYKYAGELIDLGRATLQTGTEMATEGLGTNDAFLRHTWQGRSKDEIDAARSYWQEHHHESLDDFLGINQKDEGTSFWEVLGWIASPLIMGAVSLLTGPETSGDLAMELEIAALGVPENDFDVARIAALRYQQQRVRGTGWLARLFLDDCDEAVALDNARGRLADELRAAAGLGPGDPVFDENGEILQSVRDAAFDGQGNLKTGPAAIGQVADELARAAEAYQKRLADFEAAITLGITIIVAILVVILTVILMFFGVGFVLAGIIAGVAGAILGGAATIAVKSGIRGERYGYEEMAVDIAITAIEAITAAVTGGMMRGVGTAAGAGARAGMGLLARAGARLAGGTAARAGVRAAATTGIRAGLGRVGAQIVIQAAGGAVNGAAQVAFRDETWEDGIGKGLERVLGNAVKMAAISAITAGVSEGVSVRMNSGFRALADAGDNFTLLGRVGSRLGQRGTYMLSEALGEAIGGVASEGVTILFDLAEGRPLDNLGWRLLAAGVRDAISGAGRAGAHNMARRRYAVFMGSMRARGDLTFAEFQALSSRARAAGVEIGGFGEMRRQIVEGRLLLDTIPEQFRKQVAGLPLEELRNFAAYLDGADLGGPGGRLRFLVGLEEHLPGFDGLRTYFEAEAHIATQRRVQERHQHMRATLGAELPARVRSVLDDVPMRMLEALPEGELRALASAVADGHLSADALARLTDIAARNSSGLNKADFQAAVRAVVEAGDLANRIEIATLLEQRRAVLADIPEQGRALFAELPPTAIRDMHTLIRTGESGSPQVRESLYRAAVEQNPGLTRARFFELLDAGIESAASHREAQRKARRAARFDLLEGLPDRVRGPLSALPDQALFEVRLLQLEGQPISPQRKQMLIDAARSETPQVREVRLSHALDSAVELARPTIRISEAQAAALRGHLEEAAHPSARHALADIDIVVLNDRQYRAFAGTDRGDATTLVVHGRPVVALREGAAPGPALRREGARVLDLLDPDGTLLRAGQTEARAAPAPEPLRAAPAPPKDTGEPPTLADLQRRTASAREDHTLAQSMWQEAETRYQAALDDKRVAKAANDLVALQDAENRRAVARSEVQAAEALMDDARQELYTALVEESQFRQRGLDAERAARQVDVDQASARLAKVEGHIADLEGQISRATHEFRRPRTSGETATGWDRRKAEVGRHIAVLGRLRAKKMLVDKEVALNALRRATTLLVNARVALTAEQRAERAIALDDHTYWRKGGRSPDQHSRDHVEATAPRDGQGFPIDPLYGRRFGSDADALAVDHIVPLLDIVLMPGFARLSRRHQREVVNFTDNFMALHHRVNSSKKHNSFRTWRGLLDNPLFGPIPKDVRQAMIAREDTLRVQLQAMIDARLPAATRSAPAPRPPDFDEAMPRVPDVGGLSVRDRIERVTGVVPEPSDAHAQRLLAEHLRGMDVDGVHVTEVSGVRIEQGMDHTGNPMTKADGTPDGYEVPYAYQAREYRNGVTQLTVRVHLDADPSISRADIARVEANARAGVDRYFNSGHRIPGSEGRPTRLQVEVEFVTDPSHAHLVVDLRSGPGDTFQNRWHVDDDPTVLAHELGHQLGLLDEYKDHAPHGWSSIARARSNSPGVFRDNGLMGNFWARDASGRTVVHPATHLPQRNLDLIAADIARSRTVPTPIQRLIDDRVGVHRDPGITAEIRRQFEHPELARPPPNNAGLTPPPGLYSWVRSHMRGLVRSVAALWQRIVQRWPFLRGLRRTPTPGGAPGPILVGPRRPQSVLMVGPERPEEFAWALELHHRKQDILAANPLATEAARDFEREGGHFFEGPVENLPPGARFDLIREDFPVPIHHPVGHWLSSFLCARLSRLRPGGTWVIVTEAPDFVDSMRLLLDPDSPWERGPEWSLGDERFRMRVWETSMEHEATPHSEHAAIPRRFAVIIDRPEAAQAAPAPRPDAVDLASVGDPVTVQRVRTRLGTELTDHLSRRGEPIVRDFLESFRLAHDDDLAEAALRDLVRLNEKGTFSNQNLADALRQYLAFRARHGDRVRGDFILRIARAVAQDTTQAQAELQLAEDLLAGHTPLGEVARVTGLDEPQGVRTPEYRIETGGGALLAECKALTPATGLNKNVVVRNVRSAHGQVRDQGERTGERDGLIRLDARHAPPTDVAPDTLARWVSLQIRYSAWARWVEIWYRDGTGQLQCVVLERNPDGPGYIVSSVRPVTP